MLLLFVVCDDGVVTAMEDSRLDDEFLGSAGCCDFFFAVAVDVFAEADFCFRFEFGCGRIETAFPIFGVLLVIKAVLDVDRRCCCCWC